MTISDCNDDDDDDDSHDAARLKRILREIFVLFAKEIRKCFGMFGQSCIKLVVR